MQKVLLGGRVWVMSGRWAAMTLEGEVRPRLIERAWFRSIFAPYWRGEGISVTVGSYSLQFGRCTKGLDVVTSEDEFDWSEFDFSFEEHLDASLFETAGDTFDALPGQLVEPESVTAFVDTRTSTLTAVVHSGGEIEYVHGPLHHTP